MSAQQTTLAFDRDSVLDVLRCLIRDALATLRHQPAMDFDPADWTASMDLVQEGPMLDSLELMTLAGDVNRLFSLDETGLEDYLLRRRRLDDWADLILDARASTSGLRFMTSGSSGVPAEHEHAWTDLEREVRYLASVFRDRRRIICLAPRHHIYGCLWGALLPGELGVPVLVEHDAERALREGPEPGDLLVAFPLRWRYTAASIRRFGPDVIGVTSTGPCESALIDTLLAKGLERMYEVYGSTETGGIGMRSSPRAPYRLFPWWRRDPACGKRLERDPGVRFAVPDLLDWRGGTEFVPVGRVDGVVQVGGINVSPDHVARRLSAHPDVLECRVRPTQNERLKAFVVPVPGAAINRLPDAVIRWAREHLSAPERPVSVRVGDRLPVTPMGKAADWD